MTNPEHDLLWLDLETTGLRPATDYNILEIQVIKTDWQLSNVAPVFHATIRTPESALGKMNDFVQNMHTENGLLADVREATETLLDVEKRLNKAIDVCYGDGATPILAGSSIDFDREYLRAWMPAVSDRLHYRLFDVSSLKLAQQAVLHVPFRKGGGNHRAKADLMCSINHAREVFKNLSVAGEVLT